MDKNPERHWGSQFVHDRHCRPRAHGPRFPANGDGLCAAELGLCEAQRFVVNGAVIVEDCDDVAARPEDFTKQFVEPHGRTQETNQPSLAGQRQRHHERVPAVSDAHGTGEDRRSQHLRLAQCLLPRDEQLRRALALDLHLAPHDAIAVCPEEFHHGVARVGDEPRGRAVPLGRRRAERQIACRLFEAFDDAAELTVHELRGRLRFVGG